MRNKKRDRRTFSAPIKTRYSLIVLGVIFALLVAACGPDKETGFQGYLTDASGNPINGTRNITFRLFNSTTYCASGSSPNPSQAVFTETHNNVQVTNGLLNVQLGSNSTASNGLDGIDPSVFAQPLYLEIQVGSETLKPCQKLMGAPYAMTLAGGAVIGSIHEGDGAGGSDTTDINYGTLSVVATGTQGTALMVGVSTNGDLIRACSNAIGSRSCPNLRFRVTSVGEVYADGTFHTPAADFAEMVKSASPEMSLEPGDVLAISQEVDRAVVHTNQPYSTAVMGVYSTKPGFIGGSNGVEEFGGVPVAIVGIVPVKVSSEGGMIHRGDLLTSSSLAGYAMKSTQYLPGSILGKAMGELNSGVGVIDVLLMLR
jgi:hypothetical protein